MSRARRHEPPARRPRRRPRRPGALVSPQPLLLRRRAYRRHHQCRKRRQSPSWATGSSIAIRIDGGASGLSAAAIRGYVGRCFSDATDGRAVGPIIPTRPSRLRREPGRPSAMPSGDTDTLEAVASYPSLSARRTVLGARPPQTVGARSWSQEAATGIASSSVSTPFSLVAARIRSAAARLRQRGLPDRDDARAPGARRRHPRTNPYLALTLAPRRSGATDARSVRDHTPTPVLGSDDKGVTFTALVRAAGGGQLSTSFWLPDARTARRARRACWSATRRRAPTGNRPAPGPPTWDLTVRCRLVRRRPGFGAPTRSPRRVVSSAPCRTEPCRSRYR